MVPGAHLRLCLRSATDSSRNCALNGPVLANPLGLFLKKSGSKQYTGRTCGGEGSQYRSLCQRP